MSELKKYSLQESLEVVGVEDGYFKLEWKYTRTKNYTLIAIVLWKSGLLDLKLETVQVDGLDCTEAFLRGYRELKTENVNAILLGGATFAGFNIIDPVKVYSETNTPVVVVTKKKPRDESVKRALKENFEDWEVRWRILEAFSSKAERLTLKVGSSKLYLQSIGLAPGETLEIIRSTIVYGGLPEPLRIAKLIASSASRAILERLNSTR